MYVCILNEHFKKCMMSDILNLNSCPNLPLPDHFSLAKLSDSDDQISASVTGKGNGILGIVSTFTLHPFSSIRTGEF